MKLSRDIALKINFFLDEILPPIIRDSVLFGKLWNFLYKEKSQVVLDFKKRASQISREEFKKIYYETAKYHLKRETDLNKVCERQILKDISGTKVLEVGCGRGYLAEKISENCKVTATDIIIDEKLKLKNPSIKFAEAFADELPFKNKEFDTVVCTHTLEHVQNIHKTMEELRRVAKKRLIIVVPKQRPYKYTLDLHLNFFPYTHSFLNTLGETKGKIICKSLGGDIYYREDY